MEELSSQATARIVEASEIEERPTRICAIDIGSNSFHAVIADVWPEGVYREVDRLKEMVRLGRGGFTRYRISEDAMQRGVEALRRIKLLAEGRGVAEYIIFATSAVREAVNGGDFIERVWQELGLRIWPITGEQEALLIWKAVRRAVELKELSLIMDIGGGSTEYIIGDSERVDLSSSLKLGAARMTEQFIHHDPVLPEEIARLREHYRKELTPVWARAIEQGVRLLVGSSGTMENLAHAALLRRANRGDNLYREVFQAEELLSVCEQVIQATEEERKQIPGIEAKRADQVVAGALLLQETLRVLPIQEIRISPVALREGIIYHYIERNTKRIRRLAPFRSVRRRSVYELAYRMRWEAAHARHVTRMTLQLFDATRTWHGLGEHDRELLEYASLLHDIGYQISRKNHHKHSYYLIRHADLRGFSTEEIRIIAQVARLHGGKLSVAALRPLQRFAPETRARILKLAALLRLANGLDRSHFQNVQHLEVYTEEEVLKLMLETRADPQLEVWGAERGKDLFEQIFRRSVIIEARRMAV